MLLEKIRNDLKDAMRAKDQLRVDTLRGAIAAFTNELVAKGKKPTDEVTDEMAVAVLKRLSKQRQDAIEQFKKGGRAELADKESKELEILKTYVPQGASKDEIGKVARMKKEELGISDASGIGKLTGVIMKEFAGRADGNDVKSVVASLF